MLPWLVFAGAVALVVTRPRGISEAWPAALGGLAMVLLGLVAPAEALQALLETVPLFAFFLGLMLIAALAEEAGFFAWLARLAVERAAGSPRRLLFNLFVVGTLVTAVLSNDATALVLTPVVFHLVTRLNIVPTPFVFACTFVADAASFLLPVSNPVNLILLGPAEMRLDRYLLHLLPASLVVLAWNLALFLWIFRAQLRGRVDPARLGDDAVDRPYLRLVSLLLAATALGYLVATAVGFPVGAVALAGAAALAVAAAAHRRFDPPRLLRAVSWPLFPFVGGMVVLVEGVERLGLTALVADGTRLVAEASELVGILIVVYGVTVGANAINNVPMALVAAAALDGLPPEAATTPLLRYAAVLAADLGPNVSVAGSLATMLWLLMLRQRGLPISSLHYLRLGLVVTPPALLLGALALWLSSRFA